MRRAWPIALIAALFFVSACDSGGSNGGSGSDLSGPVTVKLESSGSSVTAKASGTLSVTFYYDQEDGSACPDRTTRSIGSTPAEETFDPTSVVTSCSSPDAFDGVEVSFAPGSGSSANGLILRVLDSNDSEIAADTDPSDGLGVSGGTVPNIGGSATNRIAFITDLGTENTANIYTIKPDGSDRTQVTDASANDRDPAWKPDGSRIVFSSNRGDEASRADLYTINPDGTGLLRLTSSDARDEQPAWSPDGSRIAFVRGETIYTMKADGSDVTRVTQPEKNDEAPDWKPNGNRLVFESSNRDGDDSPNDSNLYTIKPDGSDLTPVVENDKSSLNPEWSPDGSEIAFAQDQICLVVPGGSRTCAVTSNSFNNHPSWKADGSRLVFLSDRDNDDSTVDTNLFLVSPDGSNLKRLTDLPGDKFAFAPSWGP
jgi:TolB protein